MLTIWDSTPETSVPVEPERGDSSFGFSNEMIPQVSVIPYPCHNIMHIKSRRSFLATNYYRQGRVHDSTCLAYYMIFSIVTKVNNIIPYIIIMCFHYPYIIL